MAKPPLPPEQQDRTEIPEGAPPMPTMAPGNLPPVEMPTVPVDQAPPDQMAGPTPLTGFATSLPGLTSQDFSPQLMQLVQQLAFLGMGQKPAAGPQMREGEVVGPNGYTAAEMARMGLKPGDAVPTVPAAPAPAPAPAAPAPGAGTNSPTGLGTRKRTMQEELDDIAKGGKGR